MLFIETTSRESMEHDLALYLNVTIDKLYEYIDYAAKKQVVTGCLTQTFLIKKLHL